MNGGLNYLSATEAVEGIKAGDITANQLMQDCIKKIEEVEDQIKAWIYFDKEKAIEQAKAVDTKAEKGENLGPLCGIPVGIKDIFNTADMPTCMGSPVWEGFTPGNDARAVSYIKWADGIVMGKTVTAEFAVHHPGPTVNPHNFEHTPGTSSSGSAAAVASFMVPLAIGTQTAGSTIRPASYCGIHGFKPSFGLIPRTGILKTLDTLDHVSFFARSAEDLHLMLDVLRVRGPNYPLIHKFMDNSSVMKHGDDSLWKVAFVKTPVWEHAEPYAQDAILDYIKRLSDHKQIAIEEVELPEVFNRAHDVHELIYSKALSYYFEDECEKHREKISRLFLELAERGKKVGPREYLEGLENQNRFIHQLDEFFERYDIIITLSTAGEAPEGLYSEDKKDPCLIWTLCHAPAMNLPVFRSPKGLPFGAQIVGRRFKDYDLLSFARLLEREGLLKHWKNVDEIMLEKAGNFQSVLQSDHER